VGQEADAVPELEHQVRGRDEFGVPAPDLRDDGRPVARQGQLAERPTHAAPPRGEHPEVVQVPAVLGQPAGGRLSDRHAHLVEDGSRGSGGEEHVAVSQDGAGSGRLVAVAAADHEDAHPCGQGGRQFGERPADKLGPLQNDLEEFQPGAGRGLDPRLPPQEREVQEQDRPGHSERVRDRVADGRVVVADGRDRGLRRWCGGAGAREQAEGVSGVEAGGPGHQQAEDPRDEHAGQRHEVGLEPVRAGQAEDELPAVLDADRVEEQRKAKVPEDGRRGRGRREPPDGQGDEQHRPDAQGEPLDRNPAGNGADRNRQEER